jgi:hypothetical protein
LHDFYTFSRSFVTRDSSYMYSPTPLPIPSHMYKSDELIKRTYLQTSTNPF